jgi:hypothetical protein
MSKPTKGFLLTGLAIVIISVAPMIVTLIAAVIAGALGCPLDEGSVHSCVVLGVDLGGALYAMGLFAWFVMFTFPFGCARAADPAAGLDHRRAHRAPQTG